MSLLDTLYLPEDIVRERDYYEVLESHLTYIRNHSSTKVIDVGLDQAAIYKGDFYGLLNSLSVNKKYHYPIMRVNGLLCSADYDGKTSEILRPAEDTINSIITIYQSVEVI